MIAVGVGLSQNIATPRETAKDAADTARKKLAGKKATIVFAFASITYDQKEVLAGIREVFPDTSVVGGSAAGEIVSWNTVYDGINVMAIATDQFEVATGSCMDVAKDSFSGGECAARQLLEKNNKTIPDLVISILDGMDSAGSQVIEGVKSVLGENIPLIGGSTGDDYRFEKTYEYHNDKLHSGSVVLLGLTGKFSYGFGIRHGWKPVGLPMNVTKARGTLLQELDGKPAITLYEDYFGKDASELSKEPLARMAYTYPLGLEVEGSREYLIRDPIVATKGGGIRMAAAIPEGTAVRLMIGNRDHAIDAAKDAAKTARKQLGKSNPKAIIMFNCMARNKLLGIRCREENDEVNKIIGKDVPMIGFYTYGEHGPLHGKKNTPAYFHNETMTILVLGE